MQCNLNIVSFLDIGTAPDYLGC